MSSLAKTNIKFMTYNVWSCEHVAVYRRIQAISELIWRHEPDVIFLQEVTEYMYSLFQETPWWTWYKTFPSKDEKQNCSWSSTRHDKEHSNHFCVLLSKLHAVEVTYDPELYGYGPWSPGSTPPPLPARAANIPPDLLSARVWMQEHHSVRAATCHLPGPTPSDVRSMHRRARAALFFEHFDVHGLDCVEDDNVVLGGDLSWYDDLDGPLRLELPWVDAWSELRGDEGAGGRTYDAVSNPMLRGCKPERRRPDRFLCKLRNFTLDSIEMVGVEPIPGVTHCDDKGNVVPVLPSHHFGLLLTIVPKER